MPGGICGREREREREREEMSTGFYRTFAEEKKKVLGTRFVNVWIGIIKGRWAFCSVLRIFLLP